MKNLLTTISVLLGLLFSMNAYAKDYGPVGANETLWHIASHNRPSYDLSTQQTMLAIQKANPKAFSSSNINSLKTGSVIRLPSFTEIDRISRSYALREVKRDNKAWNTNKTVSSSTSSSNYKRHYKASQRELKKLQRRLKREKRKVRKLKEELAELTGSSDNGSNATTKSADGTATKTEKLQKEVARLEQIIDEKNVHIAQLNNIKTVANETIKRQQVENQVLFNKLKSIAPEEVIDPNATSGSLQLTGVDEAANAATQTMPVAGSANEPTTSATSQAAATKRNNIFILALSLLCILFIIALIWRVYSQKSARKSILTHSQKTEDAVLDDDKQMSNSTNRKDPLLST